MKYIAEKCAHCTQTLDYELRLSRGAALMVIALANAVDRLGRNRVHVGKEMIRPEKDFANYRTMVSGGWMTYKMEGNMSVLHRHGLAAMDDEKPGNWILTRKGAMFLKGEEVPAVAIVSKVSGHQVGYWEPGGTTNISKLLKVSTPWWDLPPVEADWAQLTLALSEAIA